MGIHGFSRHKERKRQTMSAFGRRNGLGGMTPGARPQFGVARPMKGVGGEAGQAAVPAGIGGEQFPPLPDEPAIDRSNDKNADAMSRLADRANSINEAPKQAEGFEASVHKIKEQVLPRLLERVDPEAAATLSKDELAEEFRPIIFEVLAELKITLNRREQFALEKVLVDELLGLGPLEELLNDPTSPTSWSTARTRPTLKRRASYTLAPIQFRDEEHLFQIAQRIVNQVGRRVDQTTPLADARLKDGSRVNVIVPPLSLRGTAISIRKFSAKPITLDMLHVALRFDERSKMATALKIAGRLPL